jgi:hypothetical protein
MPDQERTRGQIQKEASEITLIQKLEQVLTQEKAGSLLFRRLLISMR